jgi:homoserine O-succinyltransferase
LDQLWAQPPDAIIVTGTEPKTAVLSDEPYWPRLVELVDHADANLLSSIWSCLAAHAAVLHLDGIARRRLTAKRFGVFEQRVVMDHALTRGLGETTLIPHSRWNNLPTESLAAADYRLLTRSSEGEADLFINATSVASSAASTRNIRSSRQGTLAPRRRLSLRSLNAACAPAT